MVMVQHRRVLVVEDDGDVRGMLVSALREKSLTVEEAEDGRRAIELLGANRFAVILLDLLMPEVDGFNVLETINESADPPIVLVITGADRHVLDRLHPRKIHGIVKKPFDPGEIAEVVAACAEIREHGAL